MHRWNELGLKHGRACMVLYERYDERCMRKAYLWGVCEQNIMWYNEMIEIIINKLVVGRTSRPVPSPPYHPLPSHPLPSSSACISFVLSFTRSRQATIVLRGAACLNNPRLQQRFSSTCCFTIWGST